jgi:galactokinase
MRTAVVVPDEPDDPIDAVTAIAAIDSIASALGSAPSDVHFVRAPGRVNVIGDHTDYQGGLCLPAALQLEAVVGWVLSGDDVIAVTSLDLGDAVTVQSSHPDPAGMPGWGRSVAVAARVLAARGAPPPGIRAAVASKVPIGSGLASSGAFGVSITLALAAAAGHRLEGRALARTAQEIESEASGVPCGVLDQAASVFGRAGHLLLLDCRSLDVSPVPVPPDAELVVVHSGLPRILAASEYAQRTAACAAAAARIGVALLRDATPEQVADDPIARHVVTENARVQRFADAAARGNLEEMGRLMLASHASLRDDFLVSTPELDLLVDVLAETGALGARLTGAGFGGCVVALAPAGEGARVAATATDRYQAATGLTPRWWPVVPSDGAGPLDR